MNILGNFTHIVKYIFGPLHWPQHGPPLHDAIHPHSPPLMYHTVLCLPPHGGIHPHGPSPHHAIHSHGPPPSDAIHPRGAAHHDGR